jgi:hypothetical protein
VVALLGVDCLLHLAVVVVVAVVAGEEGEEGEEKLIVEMEV